MSRSKFTPYLITVLVAVVTTFATSSLADLFSAPEGVPRLLPYRGLLHQDGAPVTTEVDVAFTMFAAATPSGGETALWGPETHTVTPSFGEFSVMLGMFNSLDASALAGGDVYVELEVDGTVLDGRQRLASAPFALRSNIAVRADSAESADYADGVDWNTVDSIPAGFADNVDNEGVTGVTAGAGLAGGGTGGVVSLRFSPFRQDYGFDMITEDFGVNYINTMTPVATSFCFLTQVRVGDDNDEDDTTRCYISQVGGNWQLTGNTNANEATSACWASCIVW